MGNIKKLKTLVVIFCCFWQYEKLEEINNMPHGEWEQKCCFVNDCSICDMAIHQFLLSTTKHICVRDMSKEQLEIALDNADCDF